MNVLSALNYTSKMVEMVNAIFINLQELIRSDMRRNEAKTEQRRLES